MSDIVKLSDAWSEEVNDWLEELNEVSNQNVVMQAVMGNLEFDRGDAWTVKPLYTLVGPTILDLVRKFRGTLTPEVVAIMIMEAMQYQAIHDAEAAYAIASTPDDPARVAT